MKGTIWVILGVFSLLVLIMGLKFFLTETPFGLRVSETKLEKEVITNHPPKVETRGVGTGCGIAVAEMFFYFSDPDPNDYLTAYQLQIDDNSDFSHCPGENCLFDTGKETKISEALKSYDSTFKYSLPKELPKKVYFWRVRIWDNQDAPSDWAKATLNLAK